MMENNQLLNLILVLLVAAGLWFWLSTSAEDVFVDPLTLQPDRVALSVQEQIEQGRQVAPIFEAELGGPVFDQRQRQINRIGQTLLEKLKGLENQVRIQRGIVPGWTVFPFRFTVLNTADVNAFALPDGSVYMTVGLLEHLTTEDQIAAVLGHEIGHIVLRHTARAFESEAKGNILLWVLDTLLGDELASDVASGANLLFQLSYSRDQESQADAFGYVLTCVSDFDPLGMSQVFEVFQQLETGSDLEFLRTHPNAGRRIDQLQGLTCQFPVLNGS